AGDATAARHTWDEAAALRQKVRTLPEAVAEHQKPKTDNATIAPTSQDDVIAETRKTVGMLRHLMKTAPIFYQPALSEKLAARLDDLSKLLSEAGDADGAQVARKEVDVLLGGQNRRSSQSVALATEAPRS